MDVQADLIERAERSAAQPDGVTLLVITPDRDIARIVAPYLATALFPGRLFGAVLHSEADPRGWAVTVADHGPARPV